MDRHLFQRFGKGFFAASLAAMLVMPPHVATCCGAEKVASSESKSCCHTSQHAAAKSIATHATCGSSYDACKCVCCRPANQQTVPPTRTADNGQPDHTLALVAFPATLSAADAGTAFTGDPLAAFGAVAVPHRILHCSWLI